MTNEQVYRVTELVERKKREIFEALSKRYPDLIYLMQKDLTGAKRFFWDNFEGLAVSLGFQDPEEIGYFAKLFTDAMIGYLQGNPNP